MRDGWPGKLSVAEASRMAALVRAVPVLELSSIDWTFDAHFWAYTRPFASVRGWFNLFDAHSSTAGSLAWFAISTLDRSGFVRQAAVEALSRATPTEAVPFLVLRTTDWVPEVRTAAETALLRCLERLTPGELLPSLEVALHAEARVRAPRLAGARAVIEKMRAVRDDVLAFGVKAGEIRSQRWCLRELVARRSSLLTDALGQLLQSAPTSLRFEAATLVGQIPREARFELLDLAFATPVGFVRRAAAETVPSSELRESDLERLLLDSNRAARTLAQREWQKRHGSSPAAFYRDRLKARRAALRAIALLGLTEVGSEDDAAEAVVRLDDRSWRVRQAALRCIGRLAPSEAEGAALEALRDSSHKVADAAARIALRHPSRNMQSEVERLLLNGQPSRRRTGLKLLWAGDVAWQAEMLERMMREFPAAQPEALRELDNLVTEGFMGRPLPPVLRDRLLATVGNVELPPPVDERGSFVKWNRRQRAERMRDRILFGLKSARTL